MKILFFVFAAVLMAACQNQSISTSSTSSTQMAVLPDLPDGVTEVNDNDWGIMADDGYVLNRNPWNIKAASKPYAQNVFKGVSNSISFFGWQWYWNNTNDYTVLAYPEVFCGWSPFGPMGTNGHTPGYPYIIGGHGFQSTFDITMATSPVNGKNTWDLAYDIWVLNSACNPTNFGRSDIKAEIMVWLDSRNSLLPLWLGQPNDTLIANGCTFDYYYYPNQADGNGPGGTHIYAAFSSQTPIYFSTNFNLTIFITYLVNHGIITSNDYIATVELGTEVVIGSGQTVIKNYSVIVN